jgi:serine/threonine protein kinase
MEYCVLGDLSIFIKKRGQINQEGLNYSLSGPWGGLQEVAVRNFLGQLASALELLRSKTIIHRDLKPQNILLAPCTPANTNFPILKLADFGFARTLASQSLASTLCGSPLYMAPEILRGDKYGAKADLWSLGAILYELVTGKPPFRAQNHIELLRKIEKGDGWLQFPGDVVGENNEQSREFHATGRFQTATRRPLGKMSSPNLKGAMALTGTSLGSSPKFFLPRETPPVPEDLKHLIRHLLQRDPENRISFESFFVHPSVSASRGIKTKLVISPKISEKELETPQSSNSAQLVLAKSLKGKDVVPSSMMSNSGKPWMELPFAMYGANSKHIFSSANPKDLVVMPLEVLVSASPQPPPPPSQLSSSSVSLGSSYSSIEFSEDEGSRLNGITDKVEHQLVSRNSLAGSAGYVVVGEGLGINSNNSVKRDDFLNPLLSTSPAFLTSNAVESNMQRLELIEKERKATYLHYIRKGIPVLESLPNDVIQDTMICPLIICAIQAYTVHNLAKSHQIQNLSNQNHEAFLLYVYALKIYEYGLSQSKLVWEYTDPERSSIFRGSREQVIVTNLNIIVNWLRTQFNDCLALAEECKTSRSGAYREPQQLIYNEAIELSKKAAYMEMNNNPKSKEMYHRSLILLETLLSTNSQSSAVQNLLKGLLARLGG